MNNSLCVGFCCQLCDIISKWEQTYIQLSGSRSDLTRTIRLLYKSRYCYCM